MSERERVENGRGNARRACSGPSQENQWAIGKHQRYGQLRIEATQVYPLIVILMREWSLLYAAPTALSSFYRS